MKEKQTAKPSQAGKLLEWLMALAFIAAIGYASTSHPAYVHRTSSTALASLPPILALSAIALTAAFHLRPRKARN